MNDELDNVLADPARLLTADRAAVRDHIEAADDARRVEHEVFLQAEAIFGGAEVTPAEFASWLHFAAKTTGHEEYAERIAAAEPGMPWRTVWAWWRPANWFMSHPSLNGDYFQVHHRVHEDRELIEVVENRGSLWLDVETGRRVAVPDGAELKEAPLSPEALHAPELNNLNLSAPESWEGAAVIAAEGGTTRHLVVNAHGLAVLETDAEVLRDWPDDDGIDPTSAEEAYSGPEPAIRRPTGPLTAARVDDAFGARHVLRIPESALPEGLEHPGSRQHLTEIGIPAWWVCHGCEFDALAADAMRPPADGALSEEGLPDGVVAADLIALGSCEHGELYVHRHDGSVHIWTKLGRKTGEGLVAIAPDLDFFTRALEAVHRYSNACWHPYPVEGGQDSVAQVFLEEMDELAPGVFDPDTPGGTVWSWIYAGITELGVDGF
ncbi:SUKH-4 family immunity protein [Streptomyces tailanensis]|uniref:SUKH-4 family immunity protein n=1 Tax=Streptomyces tailanensis TaxID=2569858 RepID=UPI00122E964F|nr:SUKH-4 family immunity protein [Streptomyces tailanensis]